MNNILKSCRIKRDQSRGLNESVEKSRQIFLINYSIDVKKEEILRLNKEIVNETKKLEEDEKRLKSKGEEFDKKLKESDREAVEAIKS